MATVTLPVYVAANHRTVPFGSSRLIKDFEIDQLSFTRSITRQGKGARAAWRHQFRTLPEVPQSHEAAAWNKRWAAWRDGGYTRPMYGIRAVLRPFNRDPWAMIDRPEPIMLHGDEQAAPGSDDF